MASASEQIDQFYGSLQTLPGFSAVRGKLRQRTVSLYRSMSYGLFCPGTI